MKKYKLRGDLTIVEQNYRGVQSYIVKEHVDELADVRRQTAEGWVQDDERSGGVDVTIWAEKLGEQVLEHFRKGARVVVEGDLHLNEYDDAAGVHHAGMRMTGESVALLPWRIEKVTFSAKRERESERESEPA